MTVEILTEGPDDAESALITWLGPLYPNCVRNRRDPDDLLPFIIVNHIDGKENAEEGTTDELVSVATLCDKSLGDVVARDACDRVHRRMLLQARHLEDVTLPSGRVATIDYVKVFKRPKWIFYADHILQKVGLYTVGFSYARIT